MNELKEYANVKTRTRETEFGPMTILETENGISAHGQIGWDGKTILADYVYKADGTYDPVYSFIGSDGIAGPHLQETAGILPSLFLDPGGRPWVSLVAYDPDRELEITVPLFGRAEMETPKGHRPFLGRWAGICGAFPVFHDADLWSDTKPDRLLLMEFKDGVLKKRHNKKAALPRDNKIYPDGDSLHLIAREGNSFLHREINAAGEELRRRTIDLGGRFFQQVLSLSFGGPSRLLAEEEGKISVLEIDRNGAVAEQEIMKIGEPFFNTWTPAAIGPDIRVMSFNTQAGNGWFTIRGGELLEFFYSKDERGFRELLSGRVLDMEDDKLIVPGISRTRELAYAVSFYSIKSKTENEKTLFLLNRALR
ncbi:hypothetical protein [Breznakiella homolactica]|uniref:Uncharacterized protein n=1 Tax=Breznakiella homolactica TaxID=2798577 RepID=A0A7T8B902_9SPIR|nr:hypothetical protein [Breznakiella homolactica]QQO09124.1 hypothetical protein JFL75_19685 [Breznakiella homolactica]